MTVFATSSGSRPGATLRRSGEAMARPSRRRSSGAGPAGGARAGAVGTEGADTSWIGVAAGQPPDAPVVAWLAGAATVATDRETGGSFTLDGSERCRSADLADGRGERVQPSPEIGDLEAGVAVHAGRGLVGGSRRVEPGGEPVVVGGQASMAATVGARSSLRRGLGRRLEAGDRGEGQGIGAGRQPEDDPEVGGDRHGRASHLSHRRPRARHPRRAAPPSGRVAGVVRSSSPRRGGLGEGRLELGELVLGGREAGAQPFGRGGVRGDLVLGGLERRGQLG